MNKDKQQAKVLPETLSAAKTKVTRRETRGGQTTELLIGGYGIGMCREPLMTQFERSHYTYPKACVADAVYSRKIQRVIIQSRLQYCQIFISKRIRFQFGDNFIAKLSTISTDFSISDLIPLVNK